MIGIYSACNYYITGGAAPQLQQWTLRAFKISRPILNHVRMAWACIVDKFYTMLLAGQTEMLCRQRNPVGHLLEGI